MSQEVSGLELLDGIGNTQANSLFDANMQRINSMIYEVLEAEMPGVAQAATKFAKWVLPTDVYIQQVQLEAVVAPTGANLLARVEIATVENATNFTLTAGSDYEQTTVAGNGILVTAGSAIEPKFTAVGSTVEGEYVRIRLICLKRRLT